MASIDATALHSFLTTIGDRHDGHDGEVQLTLLGGCALLLLGSTRSTLDIDYVGDDTSKTTFQQLIEQVAAEQHLHVDAVPIDQFVPIPPDSASRRIHMGRFGQIDVFVLDPYVIALSKLDRGFDTDIDDIVFLLRHDLLDSERLRQESDRMILRAAEFDIDPFTVATHFDAVTKRLGIS